MLDGSDLGTHWHHLAGLRDAHLWKIYHLLIS